MASFVVIATSGIKKRNSSNTAWAKRSLLLTQTGNILQYNPAIELDNVLDHSDTRILIDLFQYVAEAGRHQSNVKVIDKCKHNEVSIISAEKSLRLRFPSEAIKTRWLHAFRYCLVCLNQHLADQQQRDGAQQVNNNSNAVAPAGVGGDLFSARNQNGLSSVRNGTLVKRVMVLGGGGTTGSTGSDDLNLNEAQAKAGPGVSFATSDIVIDTVEEAALELFIQGNPTSFNAISLHGGGHVEFQQPDEISISESRTTAVSLRNSGVSLVAPIDDNRSVSMWDETPVDSLDTISVSSASSLPLSTVVGNDLAGFSKHQSDAAAVALAAARKFQLERHSETTLLYPPAKSNATNVQTELPAHQHQMQQPSAFPARLKEHNGAAGHDFTDAPPLSKSHDSNLVRLSTITETSRPSQPRLSESTTAPARTQHSTAPPAVVIHPPPQQIHTHQGIESGASSTKESTSSALKLALLLCALLILFVYGFHVASTHFMAVPLSSTIYASLPFPFVKQNPFVTVLDPEFALSHIPQVIFLPGPDVTQPGKEEALDLSNNAKRQDTVKHLTESVVPLLQQSLGQDIKPADSSIPPNVIDVLNVVDQVNALYFNLERTQLRFATEASIPNLAMHFDANKQQTLLAHDQHPHVFIPSYDRNMSSDPNKTSYFAQMLQYIYHKAKLNEWMQHFAIKPTKDIPNTTLRTKDVIHRAAASFVEPRLLVDGVSQAYQYAQTVMNQFVDHLLHTPLSTETAVGLATQEKFSLFFQTVWPKVVLERSMNQIGESNSKDHLISLQQLSPALQKEVLMFFASITESDALIVEVSTRTALQTNVQKQQDDAKDDDKENEGQQQQQQPNNVLDVLYDLLGLTNDDFKFYHHKTTILQNEQGDATVANSPVQSTTSDNKAQSVGGVDIQNVLSSKYYNSLSKLYILQVLTTKVERLQKYQDMLKSWDVMQNMLQFDDIVVTTATSATPVAENYITLEAQPLEESPQPTLLANERAHLTSRLTMIAHILNAIALSDTMDQLSPSHRFMLQYVGRLAPFFAKLLTISSLAAIIVTIAYLYQDVVFQFVMEGLVQQGIAGLGVACLLVVGAALFGTVYLFSGVAFFAAFGAIGMFFEHAYILSKLDELADWYADLGTSNDDNDEENDDDVDYHGSPRANDGETAHYDDERMQNSQVEVMAVDAPVVPTQSLLYEQPVAPPETGLNAIRANTHAVNDESEQNHIGVETTSLRRRPSRPNTHLMQHHNVDGGDNAALDVKQTTTAPPTNDHRHKMITASQQQQQQQQSQSQQQQQQQQQPHQRFPLITSDTLIVELCRILQLAPIVHRTIAPFSATLSREESMVVNLLYQRFPLLLQSTDYALKPQLWKKVGVYDQVEVQEYTVAGGLSGYKPPTEKGGKRKDKGGGGGLLARGTKVVPICPEKIMSLLWHTKSKPGYDFMCESVQPIHNVNNHVKMERQIYKGQGMIVSNRYLNICAGWQRAIWHPKGNQDGVNVETQSAFPLPLSCGQHDTSGNAYHQIPDSFKKDASSYYPVLSSPYWYLDACKNNESARSNHHVWYRDQIELFGLADVQNTSFPKVPEAVQKLFAQMPPPGASGPGAIERTAQGFPLLCDGFFMLAVSATDEIKAESSFSATPPHKDHVEAILAQGGFLIRACLIPARADLPVSPLFPDKATITAGAAMCKSLPAGVTQAKLRAETNADYMIGSFVVGTGEIHLPGLPSFIQNKICRDAPTLSTAGVKYLLNNDKATGQMFIEGVDTDFFFA